MTLIGTDGRAIVLEPDEFCQADKPLMWRCGLVAIDHGDALCTVVGEPHGRAPAHLESVYACDVFARYWRRPMPGYPEPELLCLAHAQAWQNGYYRRQARRRYAHKALGIAIRNASSRHCDCDDD